VGALLTSPPKFGEGAKRLCHSDQDRPGRRGTSGLRSVRAHIRARQRANQRKMRLRDQVTSAGIGNVSANKVGPTPGPGRIWISGDEQPTTRCDGRARTLVPRPLALASTGSRLDHTQRRAGFHACFVTRRRYPEQSISKMCRHIKAFTQAPPSRPMSRPGGARARASPSCRPRRADRSSPLRSGRWPAHERWRG
jgi:hypothetical protein